MVWWCSPLLKAFLRRRPREGLTTAHRGKEGHFHPVFQHRIDRTSVAVDGHRKPEFDPFGQVQLSHELTNG